MIRVRVSLLIAILAAAAAANAQTNAEDPATLITQATTAYLTKHYAKAVELYEAAINAGATTSSAPYNAACCCALMGKTDDAFVWLDKALDAGWRNVEHLKADSDFDSIHADPRWAKVIARCEAKLAEFKKSLSEPALRDELLKRMAEDQRIRTVENPSFEEWRKVDGANTAYMKTVIEKHGWPGKSMVGSDGALAAFLLVQHADADPAFQKKCLPLLTKAAEQGEARAGDMAYLTDRVLVAEGKPQRYGSQFFTEGGELKPRPIEDEANLDARRKAVGLGTMAEYAEMMGTKYP